MVESAWATVSRDAHWKREPGRLGQGESGRPVPPTQLGTRKPADMRFFGCFLRWAMWGSNPQPCAQEAHYASPDSGFAGGPGRSKCVGIVWAFLPQCC